MNVGMIFAIIFTIVIIGAILALGLTQLQDFFCLGSTAQTNKAVNDVETLVDEVFILAKGSGKSFEMALPQDSTICFVNPDNPAPHPYLDTTLTWNPDQVVLEGILNDPSSTQYGSNLWVYSCGNALGEGLKMDHVIPSKSFCAPSGTTIFIENVGGSVDIQPV